MGRSLKPDQQRATAKIPFRQRGFHPVPPSKRAGTTGSGATRTTPSSVGAARRQSRLLFHRKTKLARETRHRRLGDIAVFPEGIKHAPRLLRVVDAPRSDASLEEDPLPHELGALVPRRCSLEGLGRDPGEAVSDRQDDALFHSRVDLCVAKSALSRCCLNFFQKGQLVPFTLKIPLILANLGRHSRSASQSSPPQPLLRC